MFISDKSEVRNFKYVPRKPCFSKARIEWHEIILNSIATSTQPITDLSHEDLTELLFDLFQPISFIELFELYKVIQSEAKMRETLNWDNLFQLNGKNWNQRTEQLFKKMNPLPDTFLTWCFQRKIDCRDLMPLNGLSSLDEFLKLTPQFAVLNVTRNEGRALIDIMVDLLLLDFNAEKILSLKGDSWLSELKKLRNPKAYSSLNDKSQNQWPKYAQEQKYRQGDHWQYKLNIQFTDSKDLEKKLKNLSEQVKH